MRRTSEACVRSLIETAAASAYGFHPMGNADPSGFAAIDQGARFCFSQARDFPLISSCG